MTPRPAVTLAALALACLQPWSVGAQADSHQGILSADPPKFPIGVWLQSPSNAGRYKAAGFNLYVGLWKGPTEAQLGALKQAGMPVVCSQNEVGLAHVSDPTIAGWLQMDEPDNAQPMKDPATGHDVYGPCVPPAKVTEEYARLKAKDPSRPVLLNLGQGVANDAWVGRGAGATLADYETYVKGGDIVSYDVYPVAELGPSGADRIWLIGKGLDRMRNWTNGKRPVWNVIECTHINGPDKPTPQQVRSEVWMSLIHGARGLMYFVHEFSPSFNEHALLDDPAMLAAVTRVNAEVQSYAEVLLRGRPIEGFECKPESPDRPVRAVALALGNSRFVFAIGMRNTTCKAALKVPGLSGTTVTSTTDSAVVQTTNGAWTQSFGPYEVKIYALP